MEVPVVKTYRLLALGLLIACSSVNSGYFSKLRINYPKTGSFALFSTLYAATNLCSEIKLSPEAQNHQATDIIVRLKNFLNHYNATMQWLPNFIQKESLKKHAAHEHPEKKLLEQDYKSCQANQSCRLELTEIMDLEFERCTQDKIFNKSNHVYCKALSTGIITDQFKTWAQELEK